MGAPALALVLAPRALGGLCFAASRATGAHPRAHKCVHMHTGCISCASLGASPVHPLCTLVHPLCTLAASPCTPAHPHAHQRIPVPWEPTGCIPMRRPPRLSLADWLVLQVPAWALLEGDPLPLRCRGWKDVRVTQVRFFREREALRGSSQGAELLLPAVQLHHSGRYSCQATVGNVFPKREESAPVMVVVQGEHLLPDTHPAGCSPPLPSGLRVTVHPRLLPRALLSAGAAPGGPGRAPRGIPLGPGLPQPPQPPATPRPPPARLLPGQGGGGGAPGLPPAPAAGHGAVPLGELLL